MTHKPKTKGPDGLAREGNKGQPHPKAEPAAAPERVNFSEHQPTELDKLLATDNQWVAYELGGDWREAAKELSASHPDAARRAIAWSVSYFQDYNRAWVANLPSSRWDSDGGIEIEQVVKLDAALSATGSGKPLPEWAEALVAGDWRRALATRGDGAAPAECKALESILGEARKAATK